MQDLGPDAPQGTSADSSSMTRGPPLGDGRARWRSRARALSQRRAHPRGPAGSMLHDRSWRDGARGGSGARALGRAPNAQIERGA